MDGTGRPAFAADLWIDGDRLYAIGRLPGQADETIDCTGLTIAPGFIDWHSHSDLQVLESRISNIISDGFYVAGRPHPRLHVSRTAGGLLPRQALDGTSRSDPEKSPVSRRNGSERASAAALSPAFMQTWWSLMPCASAAPLPMNSRNSRR